MTRLRSAPRRSVLAAPAAALSAALVAAIGALLAAPAAAQPAATPATGAASAPAPVVALPPANDFILKEMQLPRLSTVSDDELTRLTLPHLKKPLDLARRRQIADELRTLLESRGLALAGVGVRTVDAAQGIAAIVVIEPRFGRIDVPPVGDEPISEAHVRAVLAGQAVAKDALLDLNALDEAMFLLNDLPGVLVRANLTPSGDDGVFDLSLERARRKAYDGTVDADDYGGRFNGRIRVGAFLRWNNPTDAGDNLDLRAMVSKGGGLVVGRLGYERPIGLTPWRGSIAYSRVTYALSDNTPSTNGSVSIDEADPNGRASVFELGASRALVRGRDENLITRVGFERKKLQDRLDGFGISINKTALDLSGTLSFELRDRLLGGGFNGGSLTLLVGRLRFDDTSEREKDALLGDRATQGNFAKVLMQLSRLQRIAEGWSLYSGLSAQWALRKNLDGVEKFVLGGPQGVRSYPSGEAPADRGAIATFELRRAFGTNTSAFVLLDAGHATLQKRPADGAANTRSLNARGLGLYFSDPAWFTARASLAWRGNEKPQSDSKASDPTLYLQLQRAF